jgi:hypothetical protein
VPSPDQNQQSGAIDRAVVRPVVVTGESPAELSSAAVPSDSSDESGLIESIEHPAKVMRIGAMTKQLLEEVRQAPLDVASRTRLKEIYETSIRELASGLSPDLASELDRLAFPFDSNAPSEAELRVAQAQLVGWLEGLFHGIQATLFAQQMAARSQLDEFRQRGLPPGQQPPEQGATRSGPYL